mmetsp:Transcript_11567/g.44895  ORF Transcript_11567/g.44895 Transcript_11567/m.44895 type:complete len:234 (-) Transcript_11567:280-981(-)
MEKNPPPAQGGRGAMVASLSAGSNTGARSSARGGEGEGPRGTHPRPPDAHTDPPSKTHCSSESSGSLSRTAAEDVWPSSDTTPSSPEAALPGSVPSHAAVCQKSPASLPVPGKSQVEYSHSRGWPLAFGTWTTVVLTTWNANGPGAFDDARTRGHRIASPGGPLPGSATPAVVQRKSLPPPGTLFGFGTNHAVGTASCELEFQNLVARTAPDLASASTRASVPWGMAAPAATR